MKGVGNQLNGIKINSEHTFRQIFVVCWLQSAVDNGNSWPFYIYCEKCFLDCGQIGGNISWDKFFLTNYVRQRFSVHNILGKTIAHFFHVGSITGIKNKLTKWYSSLSSKKSTLNEKIFKFKYVQRISLTVIHCLQ